MAQIQSARSSEISTGGFHTLLKYLRILFVRDSVWLKHQHPTHPIWQHPLFFFTSLHDLRTGQEALQVSCEAVRSAELTLKQVLLELMDHLELQHMKMVGHLKSEIATVSTELTTITDTIHKLTSGNAKLQL